MLKRATQTATSAQSLVQLAEQQRQEFQSKVKSYEATVKKEFCEPTILEMRTKIERVYERAKEAAHELAANAQQSVLNTQDVQKMTKNQVEVQKKETEKTIAEAKDARQQSERAVAEAREAEKQAKRAADAGTVALNKVNSIHGKVEKAFERIEQIGKNSVIADPLFAGDVNQCDFFTVQGNSPVAQLGFANITKLAKWTPGCVTDDETDDNQFYHW